MNRSGRDIELSKSYLSYPKLKYDVPYMHFNRLNKSYDDV
jgi:hypothetical protein